MDILIIRGKIHAAENPLFASALQQPALHLLRFRLGCRHSDGWSRFCHRTRLNGIVAHPCRKRNALVPESFRYSCDERDAP